MPLGHGLDSFGLRSALVFILLIVQASALATQEKRADQRATVPFEIVSFCATPASDRSLLGASRYSVNAPNALEVSPSAAPKDQPFKPPQSATGQDRAASSAPLR